MLVVPFLIFLGLPPHVANATNRVAILLQNIVSTATFRQKKILNFKTDYPLLLPTTLGSILGAFTAVDIQAAVLQKMSFVVSSCDAQCAQVFCRRCVKIKCPKTMMRTNRSPVLHAAERAAVRKDALQAACHVPDFYHRRVQRRTSAGCARYSTASGVQQHAIRVEPWNAVGSFKGASSRKANAG